MTSNLILQVDIPSDELLGRGGGWKYSANMYTESKLRALEYSKKCQADYFCIGQRHINFRHPTYERFHIFDEKWDNYDNVLYLDSDIIIKDNAPNIFNQYGNKGFAAYPVMHVREDMEKLGVECKAKTLRKQAMSVERYYIPEDYLKSRYFNAGVHLVDRPTRQMIRGFLDTYIWDAPIADQTCLNSMVALEDIPYTYLPFEYNTLCSFVDPADYSKLFKKGWFIHLLGNAKDHFGKLVKQRKTK